MTIRGGTGTAGLYCCVSLPAVQQVLRMLPTRSCYLLFSFLSVQNLVCQVQSLLTKCEADKLRSSFENTLSNSPVLFFPGYNDIITSYCIGRSNEANRNISSCERKVKVQLPSLKLLGFSSSVFFLVFPPGPVWPHGGRWC